jgi:hypothetical protein
VSTSMSSENAQRPAYPTAMAAWGFPKHLKRVFVRCCAAREAHGQPVSAAGRSIAGTPTTDNPNFRNGPAKGMIRFGFKQTYRGMRTLPQ